VDHGAVRIQGASHGLERKPREAPLIVSRWSFVHPPCFSVLNPSLPGLPAPGNHDFRCHACLSGIMSDQQRSTGLNGPVADLFSTKVRQSHQWAD
jgi:hypothetical protein